LEQVLAQWWHPVASSEALDLLYWAMRAVLYRRTAAAINTASFLGQFVDCCLFACCPSGRWGNTERVVARCQCPVASRVVLDMPHWAMPYCSGAPPWPSKRPADEVHSFIIINFVINNNRSQRPCYGQLKLKLRHSNIYYNVISLLLCFGRPPTMMDAVLATIVAGRRANIN
jgi:hypothetical protein